MKPLATLEMGTLAGALHDAERARSDAHRAFLRVAEGAADLIGRHVAFQLDLLESVGWVQPTESTPGGARAARPSAMPGVRRRVGRLGLRARVRGGRPPPDPRPSARRAAHVRRPHPDPRGHPRSMESGRIVTEHDIRPGAWYLDGDRVAPCVAMEAGQADLVLSGYLGVDFVTQGPIGLPAAGRDCHVPPRAAGRRRGDALRHPHHQVLPPGHDDPVPLRVRRDRGRRAALITMRDGCAGFFTAEELAAGKGIVPAKIEARMRPALAQGREPDLTPMSPTQLDEAAGRRPAAGRPGDGVRQSLRSSLPLTDPIALPGGRMTMIRRVHGARPDGRPCGPGIDPRRGRHPSRRLVHGLPLHRRSRDARHA